jgi:hypothetical protein
MESSLGELFVARAAALNERGLVSRVGLTDVRQKPLHGRHFKLFHLACTFVTRAIREIEIADIFVLLRAPHVLTLDLYLNRGVPVKVLVAL